MSELKKKCEYVLFVPEALEKLIFEYKDEEDLFMQTSGIKITITPKHVKDALLRWSSGLVSAAIIVDWALFILMAGCYEAPKNDNLFYYDELWTILAEISSPKTDGELTVQRVDEYLQILSKL